MAIPKIDDWKYIFLDTSVIIDFLSDASRFDKNPEQKKRIELTHKLFEYFELTSIKEDRYVFYVSAITISELTKKINDNNIISEIIQMFSCADVTFVDFTKEIATQISKNIGTYLPNGNLNQLLSRLAKENNDNSIINARNWVTDDLKIIASAKYLKKLDVILTADKNTFIPIAEILELPVLNTSKLQLDLFENISLETSY